MKPKNRVYCYECGRPKMVFETEKKANTFIKFNSEIIEEENGFKPIRTYFCESCNGWHITSQEEKKNYTKASLRERIVEAYNKDLIMQNKFISDHFYGQYIGLFVNPKDKNRLLDLVKKYYNFSEEDCKIFIDHCTLLHKSKLKHENAYRVIERYLEDKDKLETVKIIGIGRSDKAMAFRLLLNVPCTNDIPHITIATFNGGKPVDSNYISNWIYFEQPLNIKCSWKMV